VDGDDRRLRTTVQSKEEPPMSERIRELKPLVMAVLPLVIIALAAIAQRRW
jgi:hypothetical protein